MTETRAKKNFQIALLATLIFWLLTFRTGYPFLVDDYYYLSLSYLPHFGIGDFTYMFTQRPLSTALSFIPYKFHVFEKTKVLFLVYFFLHSLGVIGIFQYCLDLFGSKEAKDSATSWASSAIALLICLYPGWFEINLMALDLPWGFGIPLLALALNSRRIWLRWLFLLLSFACLETYVLPAFALLTLEGTFNGISRPKLKQNWTIWALALASYFVLQKSLAHFFAPAWYRMDLSPRNMIFEFFEYQKLLWTLNFYKINWVSTAFETLVVLLLSIGLLSANRAYWKLLLVFLAVPIFSQGHTVILNYYAPRAIHGATVLKAVLLGVLFCEFAKHFRNRVILGAAMTVLAIAYVGHYLLIASNRSFNHAVMLNREEAIETQLRTCTSPCTVDATHLSDNLKWDWYMSKSFPVPFVQWIKERDGIDKEVRILH